MDLTAGDWIQVGTFVVGLAVAVAILKNDIRWVIKLIEDHQRTDDQKFTEVRSDIRELRNRQNNFLGDEP